MIFGCFSLSYSNLTIIRSLLPKCRLHPYKPFYPLKSSFFPNFILFYLYSSSTFQYLAYYLPIQWFPKTYIPLPNLSNYSNYQYNNPSYHSNTHWFLLPILLIPNFSTVDFHPNPNFLFSWYPFQFPTYFTYSLLVLSHSYTLFPNQGHSQYLGH